ncbi:acyltransferase [Chryseobacterium sp. G0162]|uniref:acyltransferase family protein n=1 Tax=unclassified Chryseobacterium TaxID=2593645 RepID=UPI000F4F8FAD|nr:MULTISPECIES: acyltransferase [unclassified Chryseobacterium]AZB08416.1 acyltransferase [Chryseobacterium sp. G0162]
MKRLPNITSLRFFLALLVVIFHIPQFFDNRGLPTFYGLPLFDKGREAVYMFFSLSGFLIIRQLFDEKRITGKINLKNFYIRRIIRIFPLYYLVAIIGLLYYNIILPQLGFEFKSEYNLWEGIILLFTFFPNIFATFEPGGILEILWSIGIEEQFYLLIAPLILLISLKNIKAFLLIFTVLFIGLYHMPGLEFLDEYRMMFFYFSFAGWCSLLKFKTNKYCNILQIISGVLLLIYFTTDLFINSMSEFQYRVFSMVLFGFFLIFFTQKKISFFENKKLIYLGKISYGIYMYHTIVMQSIGFILLQLVSKYNISDYAVIVSSYLMIPLITVWIAHFSYQHYEKRFLALKSSYRNISQ